MSNLSQLSLRDAQQIYQVSRKAGNPLLIDLSIENPKARLSHIKPPSIRAYFTYPSVTMELTTKSDQLPVPSNAPFELYWLTVKSEFRLVDPQTDRDMFIASIHIGDYLALPKKSRTAEDLKICSHIGAAEISPYLVHILSEMMFKSGHETEFPTLTPDLIFNDLQRSLQEQAKNDFMLANLVMQRTMKKI